MSIPKAEKETLLHHALERHRSGELPAAMALYQRLLQRSPGDADALHLLGVALHQTGRGEEALHCLREAVRARRKDASLHYNFGTVLADLGKYAEAEAALRTALKLGSREPHLEMNLGNVLAQQGKLAQALAFYEAATRRTASSVQVWFNYGKALDDAGRPEQALGAYRQATRIDPAQPDAWVNLGNLQHRLEHLEEAEQAYRRALENGANQPTVVCSLAQILLHQGRIDEAEVALRQILASPSPDALTLKLGAAIARAQHRFAEAEGALRRAAQDPEEHDARIQLAGLLRDLGRPEEALQLLESLQAVPEPLRNDVALARALVWMRTGDHAHAWPGMQLRTARLQAQRSEPRVAWAEQPLPEDLHAARVYIRREQGLGDELFYLRFVPALCARGARVLYRCGPKLAPLLARAGSVDEVIGDQEPAPAADFALCVGILPWALGAGRLCDPTPAALRLLADPERVAVLRTRLAAAGPGPFVGLTWRAGTAIGLQHGIKGKVLSKEIGLQALGESLRHAPGTLVALQRGMRPEEIELLRAASGRPVQDFNAWNEDLDDALALMAALDGYIGVSNTNMHLVAALGRTASVLLPFPREWRWAAQGRGAPFFPGFALYPQAPDGSWTAALERLRIDLVPG